MALPNTSTPPVNAAAPILGAAQQSAFATFSSIIPEQEEFIKAIRSPLSSQQDKLAERVATYVGIPFTSGLDAPAVDMGWLGGAYGLLQLFLRKNTLERPLKLKGLSVQLPKSAEILYKSSMKYSSGVVEGPQEPLTGDKLNKPFAGLTPLPPDGPDVDWALWFRTFEQEVLKKRVPITQWVTALAWHASPEMEGQINQIAEGFLQQNVPAQVLYAVVRDSLLDSVPAKYHPLAYLEKLENIKAGDLNPAALARQMEQLLTLYEAARVRATFKLERFPEISALYAAWLYYKRLPPAVAKLVESPSNFTGEETRSAYEEVVRRAKEVEERLRRTGELLEPPLTVAAAITTPPILQLSRTKRTRREKFEDEDKCRKGRRSFSRERSQTPGWRDSFRGPSRERSCSNPRGRRGSQSRDLSHRRRSSPHVSRPRCFFCNKEGHSFNGCEGWKQ